MDGDERKVTRYSDGSQVISSVTHHHKKEKKTHREEHRYSSDQHSSPQVRRTFSSEDKEEFSGDPATGILVERHFTSPPKEGWVVQEKHLSKRSQQVHVRHEVTKNGETTFESKNLGFVEVKHSDGARDNQNQRFEDRYFHPIHTPSESLHQSRESSSGKERHDSSGRERPDNSRESYDSFSRKAVHKKVHHEEMKENLPIKAIDHYRPPNKNSQWASDKTPNQHGEERYELEEPGKMTKVERQWRQDQGPGHFQRMEIYKTESKGKYTQGEKDKKLYLDYRQQTPDSENMAVVPIVTSPPADNEFSKDDKQVRFRKTIEERREDRLMRQEEVRKREELERIEDMKQMEKRKDIELKIKVSRERDDGIPAKRSKSIIEFDEPDAESRQPTRNMQHYVQDIYPSQSENVSRQVIVEKHVHRKKVHQEQVVRQREPQHEIALTPPQNRLERTVQQTEHYVSIQDPEPVSPKHISINTSQSQNSQQNKRMKTVQHEVHVNSSAYHVPKQEITQQQQKHVQIQQPSRQDVSQQYRHQSSQEIKKQVHQQHYTQQQQYISQEQQVQKQQYIQPPQQHQQVKQQHINQQVSIQPQQQVQQQYPIHQHVQQQHHVQKQQEHHVQKQQHVQHQKHVQHQQVQQQQHIQHQQHVQKQQHIQKQQHVQHQQQHVQHQQHIQHQQFVHQQQQHVQQQQQHIQRQSHITQQEQHHQRQQVQQFQQIMPPIQKQESIPTKTVSFSDKRSVRDLEAKIDRAYWEYQLNEQEKEVLPPPYAESEDSVIHGINVTTIEGTDVREDVGHLESQGYIGLTIKSETVIPSPLTVPSSGVPVKVETPPQQVLLNQEPDWMKEVRIRQSFNSDRKIQHQVVIEDEPDFRKLVLKKTATREHSYDDSDTLQPYSHTTETNLKRASSMTQIDSVAIHSSHVRGSTSMSNISTNLSSTQFTHVIPVQTTGRMAYSPPITDHAAVTIHNASVISSPAVLPVQRMPTPENVIQEEPSWKLEIKKRKMMKSDDFVLHRMEVDEQIPEFSKISLKKIEQEIKEEIPFEMSQDSVTIESNSSFVKDFHSIQQHHSSPQSFYIQEDSSVSTSTIIQPKTSTPIKSPYREEKKIPMGEPVQIDVVTKMPIPSGSFSAKTVEDTPAWMLEAKKRKSQRSEEIKIETESETEPEWKNITLKKVEIDLKKPLPEDPILDVKLKHIHPAIPSHEEAQMFHEEFIHHNTFTKEEPAVQSSTVRHSQILESPVKVSQFTLEEKPSLRQLYQETRVVRDDSSVPKKQMVQIQSVSSLPDLTEAYHYQTSEISLGQEEQKQTSEWKAEVIKRRSGKIKKTQIEETREPEWKTVELKKISLQRSSLIEEDVPEEKTTPMIKEVIHGQHVSQTQASVIKHPDISLSRQNISTSQQHFSSQMSVSRQESHSFERNISASTTFETHQQKHIEIEGERTNLKSILLKNVEAISEPDEPKWQKEVKRQKIQRSQIKEEIRKQEMPRKVSFEMNPIIIPDVHTTTAPIILEADDLEETISFDTPEDITDDVVVKEVQKELQQAVIFRNETYASQKEQNWAVHSTRKKVLFDESQQVVQSTEPQRPLEQPIKSASSTREVFFTHLETQQQQRNQTRNPQVEERMSRELDQPEPVWEEVTMEVNEWKKPSVNIPISPTKSVIKNVVVTAELETAEPQWMTEAKKHKAQRIEEVKTEEENLLEWKNVQLRKTPRETAHIVGQIPEWQDSSLKPIETINPDSVIQTSQVNIATSEVPTSMAMFHFEKQLQHTATITEQKKNFQNLVKVDVEALRTEKKHSSPLPLKMSTFSQEDMESQKAKDLTIYQQVYQISPQHQKEGPVFETADTSSIIHPDTPRTYKDKSFQIFHQKKTQALATISETDGRYEKQGPTSQIIEKKISFKKPTTSEVEDLSQSERVLVYQQSSQHSASVVHAESLSFASQKQTFSHVIPQRTLIHEYTTSQEVDDWQPEFSKADENTEPENMEPSWKIEARRRKSERTEEIKMEEETMPDWKQITLKKTIPEKTENVSETIEHIQLKHIEPTKTVHSSHVDILTEEMPQSKTMFHLEKQMETIATVPQPDKSFQNQFIMDVEASEKIPVFKKTVSIQKSLKTPSESQDNIEIEETKRLSVLQHFEQSKTAIHQTEMTPQQAFIAASLGKSGVPSHYYKQIDELHYQKPMQATDILESSKHETLLNMNVDSQRKFPVYEKQLQVLDSAEVSQENIPDEVAKHFRVYQQADHNATQIVSENAMSRHVTVTKENVQNMAQFQVKNQIEETTDHLESHVSYQSPSYKDVENQPKITKVKREIALSLNSPELTEIKYPPEETTKRFYEHLQPGQKASEMQQDKIKMEKIVQPLLLVEQGVAPVFHKEITVSNEGALPNTTMLHYQKQMQSIAVIKEPSETYHSQTHFNVDSQKMLPVFEKKMPSPQVLYSSKVSEENYPDLQTKGLAVFQTTEHSTIQYHQTKKQEERIMTNTSAELKMPLQYHLPAQMSNTEPTQELKWLPQEKTSQFTADLSVQEMNSKNAKSNLQTNSSKSISVKVPVLSQEKYSNEEIKNFTINQLKQKDRASVIKMPSHILAGEKHDVSKSDQIVIIQEQMKVGEGYQRNVPTAFPINSATISQENIINQQSQQFSATHHKFERGQQIYHTEVVGQRATEVPYLQQGVSPNYYKQIEIQTQNFPQTTSMLHYQKQMQGTADPNYQTALKMTLDATQKELPVMEQSFNIPHGSQIDVEMQNTKGFTLHQQSEQMTRHYQGNSSPSERVTILKSQHQYGDVPNVQNQIESQTEKFPQYQTLRTSTTASENNLSNVSINRSMSHVSYQTDESKVRDDSVLEIDDWKPEAFELDVHEQPDSIVEVHKIKHQWTQKGRKPEVIYRELEDSSTTGVKNKWIGNVDHVDQDIEISETIKSKRDSDTSVETIWNIEANIPIEKQPKRTEILTIEEVIEPEWKIEARRHREQRLEEEKRSQITNKVMEHDAENKMPKLKPTRRLSSETSEVIFNIDDDDDDDDQLIVDGFQKQRHFFQAEIPKNDITKETKYEHFNYSQIGATIQKQQPILNQSNSTGNFEIKLKQQHNEDTSGEYNIQQHKGHSPRSKEYGETEMIIQCLDEEEVEEPSWKKQIRQTKSQKKLEENVQYSLEPEFHKISLKKLPIDSYQYTAEEASWMTELKQQPAHQHRYEIHEEYKVPEREYTPQTNRPAYTVHKLTEEVILELEDYYKQKKEGKLKSDSSMLHHKFSEDEFLQLEQYYKELKNDKQSSQISFTARELTTNDIKELEEYYRQRREQIYGHSQPSITSTKLTENDILLLEEQYRKNKERYLTSISLQMTREFQLEQIMQLELYYKQLSESKYISTVSFSHPRLTESEIKELEWFYHQRRIEKQNQTNVNFPSKKLTEEDIVNLEEFYKQRKENIKSESFIMPRELSKDEVFQLEQYYIQLRNEKQGSSRSFTTHRLTEEEINELEEYYRYQREESQKNPEVTYSSHKLTEEDILRLEHYFKQKKENIKSELLITPRELSEDQVMQLEQYYKQLGEKKQVSENSFLTSRLTESEIHELEEYYREKRKENQKRLEVSFSTHKLTEEDILQLEESYKQRGKNIKSEFSIMPRELSEDHVLQLEQYYKQLREQKHVLGNSFTTHRLTENQIQELENYYWEKRNENQKKSEINFSTHKLSEEDILQLEESFKQRKGNTKSELSIMPRELSEDHVLQLEQYYKQLREQKHVLDNSFTTHRLTEYEIQELENYYRQKRNENQKKSETNFSTHKLTEEDILELEESFKQRKRNTTSELYIMPRELSEDHVKQLEHYYKLLRDKKQGSGTSSTTHRLTEVEIHELENYYREKRKENERKSEVNYLSRKLTEEDILNLEESYKQKKEEIKSEFFIMPRELSEEEIMQLDQYYKQLGQEKHVSDLSFTTRKLTESEIQELENYYHQKREERHTYSKLAVPTRELSEKEILELEEYYRDQKGGKHISSVIIPRVLSEDEILQLEIYYRRLREKRVRFNDTVRVQRLSEEEIEKLEEYYKDMREDKIMKVEPEYQVRQLTEEDIMELEEYYREQKIGNETSSIIVPHLNEEEITQLEEYYRTMREGKSQINEVISTRGLTEEEIQGLENHYRDQRIMKQQQMESVYITHRLTEKEILELESYLQKKREGWKKHSLFAPKLSEEQIEQLEEYYRQMREEKVKTQITLRTSHLSEEEIDELEDYYKTKRLEKQKSTENVYVTHKLTEEEIMELEEYFRKKREGIEKSSMFVPRELSEEEINQLEDYYRQMREAKLKSEFVIETRRLSEREIEELEEYYRLKREERQKQLQYNVTIHKLTEEEIKQLEKYFEQKREEIHKSSEIVSSRELTDEQILQLEEYYRKMSEEKLKSDPKVFASRLTEKELQELENYYRIKREEKMKPSETIIQPSKLTEKEIIELESYFKQKREGTHSSSEIVTRKLKEEEIHQLEDYYRQMRQEKYKSHGSIITSQRLNEKEVNELEEYYRKKREEKEKENYLIKTREVTKKELRELEIYYKEKQKEKLNKPEPNWVVETRSRMSDRMQKILGIKRRENWLDTEWKTISEKVTSDESWLKYIEEHRQTKLSEDDSPTYQTVPDYYYNPSGSKQLKLDQSHEIREAKNITGKEIEDTFKASNFKQISFVKSSAPSAEYPEQVHSNIRMQSQTDIFDLPATEQPVKKETHKGVVYSDSQNIILKSNSVPNLMEVKDEEPVWKKQIKERKARKTQEIHISMEEIQDSQPEWKKVNLKRPIQVKENIITKELNNAPLSPVSVITDTHQIPTKTQQTKEEFTIDFKEWQPHKTSPTVRGVNSESSMYQSSSVPDLLDTSDNEPTWKKQIKERRSRRTEEVVVTNIPQEPEWKKVNLKASRLVRSPSFSEVTEKIVTTTTPLNEYLKSPSTTKEFFIDAEDWKPALSHTHSTHVHSPKSPSGEPDWKREVKELRARKVQESSEIRTQSPETTSTSLKLKPADMKVILPSKFSAESLLITSSYPSTESHEVYSSHVTHQSEVTQSKYEGDEWRPTIPHSPVKTPSSPSRQTMYKTASVPSLNDSVDNEPAWKKEVKEQRAKKLQIETMSNKYEEAQVIVEISPWKMPMSPTKQQLIQRSHSMSSLGEPEDDEPEWKKQVRERKSRDFRVSPTRRSESARFKSDPEWKQEVQKKRTQRAMTTHIPSSQYTESIEANERVVTNRNQQRYEEPQNQTILLQVDTLKRSEINLKKPEMLNQPQTGMHQSTDSVSLMQSSSIVTKSQDFSKNTIISPSRKIETSEEAYIQTLSGVPQSYETTNITYSATIPLHSPGKKEIEVTPISVTSVKSITESPTKINEQLTETSTDFEFSPTSEEPAWKSEIKRRRSLRKEREQNEPLKPNQISLRELMHREFYEKMQMQDIDRPVSSVVQTKKSHGKTVVQDDEAEIQHNRTTDHTNSSTFITVEKLIDGKSFGNSDVSFTSTKHIPQIMERVTSETMQELKNLQQHSREIPQGTSFGSPVVIEMKIGQPSLDSHNNITHEKTLIKEQINEKQQHFRDETRQFSNISSESTSLQSEKSSNLEEQSSFTFAKGKHNRISKTVESLDNLSSTEEEKIIVIEGTDSSPNIISSNSSSVSMTSSKVPIKGTRTVKTIIRKLVDGNWKDVEVKEETYPLESQSSTDLNSSEIHFTSTGASGGPTIRGKRKVKTIVRKLVDGEWADVEVKEETFPIDPSMAQTFEQSFDTTQESQSTVTMTEETSYSKRKEKHSSYYVEETTEAQ